MAIYESTFTGRKLSNVEFEDLKAGITIDDLGGYFSREDLERLTAQSDCFGLRFYNFTEALDESARSSFLVAAAVNADGFDLPNGLFLLSDKSDSNKNDQPAREVTRAEVLTIWNTVPSPWREPFTSFFLKETIEGLLEDDQFSGICFYMTDFSTSNKTHLAINSNINGGMVVGIQTDEPFDHMLSEHPCPGHCAGFDSQRNLMVIEMPAPSAPNDLSGPYIPVWQ